MNVEALKAAGITDAEIEEYRENRLSDKVLNRLVAVRSLNESGMSCRRIAEKLGLSKNAVHYALSQKRREQDRDRRLARWHRAREDREQFRERIRGKRPPEPYTLPESVTEPFDGEPWIVDRSVAPMPHQARRHGRPAPEPPPKPVRMTRVSAINAYLDGDRTALRAYLDSVGR